MTGIVVPYHLDEYLPDLDVPVDADTVVSLKLPEGGPWKRMAALYDRVAEVVAKAAGDGVLPVVASGDCTTSLGTVAGLQRAVGDVSVVWFDAHGDLNTPEGSASGYLGGTPLRTLVGAGEPTVPETIGLVPVPEERALLVDGRDLDPPEEEFLRDSEVRRRDVAALATANAGPLPPGPIYLHIDFDVIDADDLPGLKYPVTPGPKQASVVAALREVLATGRVAAVGLGCTWHAGGGTADALRPLLADLLA